MKGRVIVLGEVKARPSAALWIDGRIEDLVVTPPDDRSRPGAIYRATADRPLKGQGGMMMRLPDGMGFFRGAKGLTPGQSLLVQVTSVPEPGKAVLVTDRVLFKGRSVIVTPMAPGLNISRRIKDDDVRIDLHDLATEVMGDSKFGLIMRSAAADLDLDDIQAELEALLATATQVMNDTGTMPELLLEGPDGHELAWREWASPPPDAIEQGPTAFDDLGVSEEIDVALGPMETLPSQATLFVEPTRALVAVDVNTGPDTSPSATLKANIAAAKALPRALRLRGLGGQITVDFAPLSKRDRRQVEGALRAAFRADPVETALVGWTPLGHFELQRKRERMPLKEAIG